MKKGEVTRERIVGLAAPIFNQKGYAGTSLNDLMEATGLEKGGIYRHFASKQELARDAFDYAWRKARRARLEGLAETPNAVDKLKRFVENFRKRPAGLVAGGCPLLNTAVDADDCNPELRARAKQAFADWAAGLEAIVRAGKKAGEIARDVNAAELATVIISTLEGAVVLSRLQRTMEPLEVACAHLVSHLERSVRA